MSIFKSIPPEALLINRKDPDHILSSYSEHCFLLDGFPWPTAEHYYQAHKFQNSAYQQKIRESESPSRAYQLGNSWFRKKRPDFKRARVTLMTRAMYTKCKTHEAVSKELLDTGETYIADNSFSDYFWGCGRDGRGNNYFGKVLMNVRKKLVEESQETQSGKRPTNAPVIFLTKNAPS